MLNILLHTWVDLQIKIDGQRSSYMYIYQLYKICFNLTMTEFGVNITHSFLADVLL